MLESDSDDYTALWSELKLALLVAIIRFLMAAYFLMNMEIYFLLSLCFISFRRKGFNGE